MTRKKVAITPRKMTVGVIARAGVVVLVIIIVVAVITITMRTPTILAIVQKKQMKIRMISREEEKAKANTVITKIREANLVYLLVLRQVVQVATK
jgi:hypothetical protein